MNQVLFNEVSKFKPNDEQETEEKNIMLDFIKTYDDVLTRNNKIGHFTTSAWIVNKTRTKVLMIYHNIYKAWTFVGGHADGDVDLIHVIKKEIGEESGLTNVKLLTNEIFGLNTIAVDHHIRRGEYVNSHLHFDVEYVFEADENDKIRIKEDENSGIEWVNIDELLTKDGVQDKMKTVFERLNKKLKITKI